MTMRSRRQWEIEERGINEEPTETQIRKTSLKTTDELQEICRLLLHNYLIRLLEEISEEKKMSNRGYLEHIWFMWLLLDLLFYFAVTSPLNYWVKPMILIKLCCNELLGFVFSFCQAARNTFLMFDCTVFGLFTDDSNFLFSVFESKQDVGQIEFHFRKRIEITCSVLYSVVIFV